MLKHNGACIAVYHAGQCCFSSVYRRLNLQLDSYLNARRLSPYSVLIQSTDLKSAALLLRNYAAFRGFGTTRGTFLPLPSQPRRLATRVAVAPTRLHQPSPSIKEHNDTPEGLHLKNGIVSNKGIKSNKFYWGKKQDKSPSRASKLSAQSTRKSEFRTDGDSRRLPSMSATKQEEVKPEHTATDVVVADDSPEVKAMQDAHALRQSQFLLRSFVSMCAETDLLSLAYHHVQRIRKLVLPPSSSATGIVVGKPDLRVYNTLLRAYAKQCNGARIYEITKWIADDRLAPDAFTFAHWLEFLGRDAVRRIEAGQVIEKERDAVQVTLNQMERCKMQPRDIFRRCQFLADEREMIMHAIRLVDSEFAPTYTSKKPLDNYHVSLLSPLNNRDFRGHAVDNRQQPVESPYYGLFTSEMLTDSLEEQMKAERVGKLEVRSIFQDRPHLRVQNSEQARIDIENNTWKQRVQNEIDDIDRPEFRLRQQKVEHYRAILDEQKKTWHAALTQYLTRERSRIINAPQGSKKPSMDPYLLALKPAELAEVLVDELMMIAGFSPHYSPGLFTLEQQLGTAVHRRFMIRCKEQYGVLDTLHKALLSYYEYFLPPSNEQSEDAADLSHTVDVNSLNHRQYWLHLVRQISSGPSSTMPQALWPREIRLQLGSRLYEILVEANVVMVPDNVLRKPGQNLPSKFLLPAVFTIHRMKKSGTTSVQVKANPRLAKLVKLAELNTLTFDVQMCPMLVPPLPWVTQTTGGYLLSPTTLTRLPEQARTVKSVVDAARPRTLYPIFDALNILGAAPWKVNTEMLDLCVGIFNHGGMPDLDVPSPATVELEPTKLHGNMTDLQKIREVHKQKAEMNSLWCEALYKLSIAEHFRNRYFFLPHNMDFRGRVYPVAPHLQQMSNDLTRSLMLFAKGRPLGPNGFDWLKIHCINLTGTKKKESMRARLQYANEMMSEILDSAEKPLTGRGWWKLSDDPWQTLACCKEIRNVLKSDVPPEDYVSSYPVHQDGSCNGLQHYAALGRDKHGAKSVNLRPNPTPQDVYSSVAARVEAKRVQDAAGENVEQATCAKILEGFVQRKVVKQTVMTIVYGVTTFGARAQIKTQLEDLHTFPQEHASAAARYLAIQTFAGIGELFKSARNIQDWFTRCARDICRLRGLPVEWHTPLGLPVSQPYYKYAVPNAYTTRAFALVKHACPYKQANGFAPNYIHSLDSTHMMLTALYCHRANLSFVAVHDSFWTHPSTLESMGKTLREQFVALHEKPLLENLSKGFAEQYTIKHLPNFDLQAEIEEAESLKESDLEGVDAALKPSRRRKAKKSELVTRRESKMSLEMRQLTPAQRKRYEKYEFNKLLLQVPEKGSFDLREVLASEYFFS